MRKRIAQLWVAAVVVLAGVALRHVVETVAPPCSVNNDHVCSSGSLVPLVSSNSPAQLSSKPAAVMPKALGSFLVSRSGRDLTARSSVPTVLALGRLASIGSSPVPTPPSKLLSIGSSPVPTPPAKLLAIGSSPVPTPPAKLLPIGSSPVPTPPTKFVALRRRSRADRGTVATG